MSRVISCPTLVQKPSFAHEPICAVLMSTYNGEKYIIDQMNSILSQKHVDVYLFIRDDGSKDNTIRLLWEFKKTYPDRINISVGENKGISRSFAELVISTPVYDYIAFSDQDDRWDNDKLIIAINALEENSASFYSSASRLVGQDLRELKVTTSNKKKANYYMCGNSKLLTPGAQGCTIVITGEFFGFLKRRNFPDKYGHDTWITVVAYLLRNCIYDDVTHMDYRQHNSSWTGNRSRKIKQYFVRARFFMKGLERYTRLANDVLERYDDLLSEVDREVLYCIGEKKKNVLGRMKDLKKYRFGKYGFLENVVYRVHYGFCPQDRGNCK